MFIELVEKDGTAFCINSKKIDMFTKVNSEMYPIIKGKGMFSYRGWETRPISALCITINTEDYTFHFLSTQKRDNCYKKLVKITSL